MTVTVGKTSKKVNSRSSNFSCSQILRSGSKFKKKKKKVSLGVYASIKLEIMKKCTKKCDECRADAKLAK